MKIKRVLNYSFILLLSIFITFNIFAFKVNCDDSTNTSTYSTESGISITLPEGYDGFTIWDKAPEDSPGWKKLGAPSHKTMLETLKQNRMELSSYRNDMTNDSGYLVSIRNFDAPEDLTNDNLLSSYIDNLGFISDTDNLSVFGYGITKINDLTYFKVYFETGGDSFDNAYSYLLVTKSGIVHQLTFLNHCLSSDIYHLDYLTYSVMSSLSLSDELINDAVVLEGNSFGLLRGHHQATFNFEDVDKNNINKVSNNTPVNKTPYQKFISFEFPIWIILIGLLTILLFGLKVSKKNEWQENALSINNSRPIQGFAALAIIIHHLVQTIFPNAGVLNVFNDLGVLFVGVFFFFSGYGLYTSLKTKKDYLKGFLKKRLTTVLIPLYVCILLYMLSACIKGYSYSLPDFLATISGWILINSHMWYIIEITILYIAFYIIYSLISNMKTATCVISVFVFVLTVFSLLLGHGKDLSSKYWFMGEWWYNTTFAYILGIVVSQNKEKLEVFAKKNYRFLLPLFVFLTIAFYFLTNYALANFSYWNEYPGYSGYKEKFICLAIQLPWVLFFVTSVILIMLKVKFSNPILKLLGSISLELYLIHNLFLLGLSDGSIMAIRSRSMFMLLTILLSIVAATLINGFDNYFIGLINNPNKLQTSNDDKRIHSIDTLRIVMAFLVVTIHIPFKGTTGDVFITYGKTAVPFFLVVCGYLLYRKDNKEMMKRLKKQTIKIFVLYVGSNLLYFIANLIIASINKTKFYITSDQIKDFLLYNMSPFSEHLWFLGSLLYALIILMILNKLKIVDYAMYISPLLICTYVFLSHLNIAPAYALRNVILVGLPYTMMGMLIRRFKDILLKIKTPIYWLMALVLCVTAIIELNTYKQGINVPFISTEILVYVIVLLCLKYPNFGKDTLAKKMGIELSLPIYIIHVLVIMFIGYIIPTNTGLISNYGPITIFVISAILSALYVRIKKMILSRTKNH